MVYSITDWGDLTHGTNLPMTGSLKNVVIKAGTQSLSAKLILTRMVAKVALNIKVKASSGITITNYSVKNIPSRSYYIPRASEDARSDYYCYTLERKRCYHYVRSDFGK